MSSRKGKVKGRKAAAAPHPGGAAGAAVSDASFGALLAEAQRHIDEVNYDAAALLYEEAHDARPDDTRVLDALGEVLYLVGDHDRAEALLCRSAELAPAAGYSKWFYLGQMYEGAESVLAYKKGIELLQGELDTGAAGPAAARLRRELSDAWCSVAELYMTDLCDDDGAEATCDACAQRALEADANNPEAHRALANLRMCQKRAAEAAPLAERAAAICANYYPAEEGGDGGDEDDDEAEGAAGRASSSAAPALSKRRHSAAPGSLRAAAAAATAAAFTGAGASAAPAAVAAAEGPADNTHLLPPYQARKELAKMCMEVELYATALQLLERLANEDDADMEVAYLRGEAHHLAGDAAAAAEVLTAAEEALAGAVARVEALAKRERSKKKFTVPGAAAAYATDGLMALDLGELTSQLGMIRKLLAVVGGSSGAAAAAGAGMPVDGE